MGNMEKAYKATNQGRKKCSGPRWWHTTGDIYYEKIEMPFNSMMTEFFDASNINDLIERMLAYI